MASERRFEATLPIRKHADRGALSLSNRSGDHVWRDNASGMAASTDAGSVTSAFKRAGVDT